ncbi:contact-dependent growth inhibition system immunity protein [Flavobacterium suncheonense]|uniref:contact-dependent growth inhibition system immunity protein n=1 Tax=Flavobacterium suncheonense TaxID=350894 RepID=UPI0006868D22|nr:contact-dependent growth inhibition system immunity protein [Flavobacterium suncheonense]
MDNSYTETKFDNKWLDKSLEVLENQFWKEINFSSHLIKTCNELRKKQLKEFEVEDLRIMIGQNISLKYLIPLAIIELEQNILAEGDFYEGDLLISVLKSDTNYWKKEIENWKTVCDLFRRNEQYLMTFETTKSIRNEWLESFNKFENIN